MADKPRRSPARLLAPLALVAVVVALLVMLGGAGAGGGDDDGDSGGGSVGSTAPETTLEPAEPEPPPPRKTYTVKRGDTLGAISEDTDVPVETIEELNPELDPQALVTGQKIKLRE
ncbi:MAG: LysM domain-containing protein [Actinomycetota bacterium]|nr:LysM domain-containing protein [Actinomycetota bacterium]